MNFMSKKHSSGTPLAQNLLPQNQNELKTGEPEKKLRTGKKAT